MGLSHFLSKELPKPLGSMEIAENLLSNPDAALPRLRLEMLIRAVSEHDPALYRWFDAQWSKLLTELVRLEATPLDPLTRKGEVAVWVRAAQILSPPPRLSGYGQRESAPGYLMVVAYDRLLQLLRRRWGNRRRRAGSNVFYPELVAGLKALGIPDAFHPKLGPVTRWWTGAVSLEAFLYRVVGHVHSLSPAYARQIITRTRSAVSFRRSVKRRRTR
jgi:hypothetical protein